MVVVTTFVVIMVIVTTHIVTTVIVITDNMAQSIVCAAIDGIAGAFEALHWIAMSANDAVDGSSTGT
jgi:type IV secretory pathway VirB3-like protein